MNKNTTRNFLIAEEVLLGAKIYKGIKILENSHNLMKSSNGVYSLVLFHNTRKDFLKMLNKEKRDTDIVYPISEHGFYFVECQKTDADGAEKFVRRINKKDFSLTYAIILRVKKEKDIQKVIFTLIKEFFVFKNSSESLKIRGYSIFNI